MNLSITSRMMLVALILGPGCSSPPGSSTGADATQSSAALPIRDNDDPLPNVPSPYDALPEETRGLLDDPFTGDLDEMVKRRIIRAGVVFNRTQYFIDRGVQRGISYESIKLFEDELNKRLKTGLLNVHVAFVPLGRDQLFPALQSGKVDFVAAALTITPARRELVDFSIPTRTGVSEIVVTASNVPPVATADDLSGREVFVRRSSSYYESLQSLNESLTKRGRAPVTIKEAPEALEDDDVLEMVNAGLVEVSVVDDFVAEFWSQVFPNIRQNTGAAVRTGGEIAIGVRKNNPKLRDAANQWIKAYGPRTAFGNTMEKRYLESTNYVKNAAADAERAKLQKLVKFFETYGNRYDVDYLLMAAQGYQESRLDQSAKSAVGAIGVMQVMPSTGKDLAVGDITQVEPNIHAGVKYFRFMMDQFYKDEPMDQVNRGLMTLASYNAGPGRIRQLRQEAARRGLDPNRWFGNVERVVSEKIGRETVQYVSNIYKYYVAYTLVMERSQARERARGEVTKP
ncbi:MAG TPA: transporter substrate-binding domain-containing protein [Vicinamibacterales bacterium]|nr:transporter substrate-binding domain-containing protein [Vicinamibacterales bacterium]